MGMFGEYILGKIRDGITVKNICGITKAPCAELVRYKIIKLTANKVSLMELGMNNRNTGTPSVLPRSNYA